MDNINSGNTTNVILSSRSMGIARLGPSDSAAKPAYITGAVTAQILKSGPGRLHKIILGTQTSAGTLIVYDAVTASNPIYSCAWAANSNSNPIPMDMDFYNGLVVTITGANTSFTFLYE